MDAHGRTSEVSPEAMQARIQQARREAETLKDKIKRKKDELADTTRTFDPGAQSAMRQWFRCTPLIALLLRRY